MTRRAVTVAISAIVSLVLLLAVPMSAQRPASWITAWGTSQQGLATAAISNATVRMIARVTVAGESVRIRLDNTYGTAPVAIAKASVGWRRTGAAIFPGSSRPIMFKGMPDVTIPAGGSVTSDAVSLPVTARQDLAVSFHVPGAGVTPSQHGNTGVTSYLTADGSGDATTDETAKPFVNTTGSALWLKSIDVLSSSATGAVVAFGDSITDGACTVRDGYERWTDWMALRLDLEGRSLAIVNEGIGGNTLLAKHPEAIPPTGAPGLERLDRDVLSHQGVTHVVVFLGTNDLRRSSTAAMVREGMETLIKRVKERGIKILAVTPIPRHNNQQFPWDAAKTKQRNELNEWIRTKAPFDGVLDFDKVVRDPKNPDLINPVFDCDGIHPTPRGYYELGKSINLGLFAGPGAPAGR